MPDLFIDGEWVASASHREYDVINPYDQSVVAKVD